MFTKYTLFALVSLLGISSTALAVPPATVPAAINANCVPGQETYITTIANGQVVEYACYPDAPALAPAPAPTVEVCDQLCQAKKDLAAQARVGAATAKQTKANAAALLTETAERKQADLDEKKAREEADAQIVKGTLDLVNAEEAQRKAADADLQTQIDIERQRQDEDEQREAAKDAAACPVAVDVGAGGLLVLDVAGAGIVSARLTMECKSYGLYASGFGGAGADFSGATGGGGGAYYALPSGLRIGLQGGVDYFGAGSRDDNLSTSRIVGGYGAGTIGGVLSGHLGVLVSVGVESGHENIAVDGLWTDGGSTGNHLRVGAELTGHFGGRTGLDFYVPATAGE